MPSRANKNTMFLYCQNFRHNFACHHQWQESEKKKENRDTQRVEKGEEDTEEAKNRTEQDPRRVAPPPHPTTYLNYITATILRQDPRCLSSNKHHYLRSVLFQDRYRGSVFRRLLSFAYCSLSVFCSYPAWCEVVQSFPL